MPSSHSMIFKRFRFPPELIQYAVWLYFTFPLSLRDVQLILAHNGIQVSHESIRLWAYRFGPIWAQQLRQRRRQPTNVWHLDEVFLTIQRRRYYLWRAVDSRGMVLGSLLQPRRDARAAKRFFEMVLGQTPRLPRVIVTDKLRSYNIIPRELVPSVVHRRSKYLNNRAENSHQPTRRRERCMKRFKSPRQAQTFLSSFGIIHDYFHPKQHQLSASAYREELAQRRVAWQQLMA